MNRENPSTIKHLGPSKKAFILTEILLSILLIGLFLSIITIIYSMALNAWQFEIRRIALERQANIAMEKMTRGLGGTDGIREASSAWIDPASHRFYYTSGVDGKERSFKKGFSGFPNDEIIYWAIPTRPQPAAKNVQNLSFAINGKIVTINLTMQDLYRDSVVSVNLINQVRIRN